MGSQSYEGQKHEWAEEETVKEKTYSQYREALRLREMKGASDLQELLPGK